MSLPDVETLNLSLEQYPRILAARGSIRLPELDRWYRHELPTLIQQRSPRHLTLAELSKITEWKMAKGVWRARNLALVRNNSEVDVIATSSLAFAQIPDPVKPISTLANLKGIGPATASAVAAAIAPEAYPFFDEDVAGFFPGLGEVKWSLSFYRRYADALRRAAESLGSDWTPAKVEQALWAYANAGD